MFDLGNPAGEWFVVIHIALDDRGDTLGTETGQALIEIMAAFAEVRVARIAEGEDREIDGRKCRSIFGMEGRMEGGGVVRWFAIALGGGDDEDMLRGG